MNSPSPAFLSLRPPRWGEIEDLWRVDGSLRDLYVLEVAPADWLTFVSWSTRQFVFDFLVDGLAADPPSELMVLMKRGASQLLRIQTCGVNLHCHFFGGDSIELDINPTEVLGPRQHDAVLDFMSRLAQGLDRSVVLCPENCIEYPFLKFRPDSRLWETTQESPITGNRARPGT